MALWVAALTGPTSAPALSPELAYHPLDLAGFVRPLTETLPADHRDVMIGGGPDTDGTIALDVAKGLNADGYLGSRIAWVAIAFVMTIAAGLLYRPHRPRPMRRVSRLSKWMQPSAPKAIRRQAEAAAPASFRYLSLIAAEFQLIGPSRVWRSAAVLIALVSAFADYRHAAGPAALLLLIFGMSSHIGRAERPQLLALTSTMSCSPWIRRSAFVMAAISWVVAMGLPAIVRGVAKGVPEPLLLAIATAGAAAITAMCLGVLTRSAFAPRLALLIGWYVWLSL